MSDNQLPISLSPALQARLKQFQQDHQFATIDEALAAILQDFFALDHARQASTISPGQATDLTQAIPSEQAIVSPPSPPHEELDHLDNKVEGVTRQLIHLQQQMTNQYDQLRSQVATIHLSHSGLIKNLRERVEALEASTDEH